MNKLLAEAIGRLRLIAFDFDGVFTDNMVYISQDGIESVRCWRGDGMGLAKLADLGIEKIVISTEVNPVVTVRTQKLKIRTIQGCDNKVEALDGIMDEMGLSYEQVAFMGNDINDLACLRLVGLPIVVQDAHPDVIPFALYRTQTPGGYGAVREVCDLFEKVLKPSV